MAKILTTDQYSIFVTGISAFLRAQGHDVVTCECSAPKILAEIQEENPDIFLFGASMRGNHSLNLLKEVRESCRDVPIMLMTNTIFPEQSIALGGLRVNGLLLKEGDPNDILSCIDTILAGDIYVDHLITHQVYLHSIDSTKNFSLLNSALTQREWEIVELACNGMRNRAIALRCGVSEGTVKVHLRNVFQKLGIRSRSELIVAKIGMAPGSQEMRCP
ncbi:hypothetical protein L288_12445 [Sphingobium quisquiliarum P25]|uniref:HTH luxR-type domain-containing protein n=1 Tax=Sphingobium quisquiliarum P25 TaxID=1329909 RepID=T0GZY8_9SPHN|nr:MULTISPECIES: LuxR C-terminal-related transcriptional regulator [Sphingobium]EQB05448.1 hypothetical protein L288_12445 [Sphingobium quisquiliarum P25]EZP71973.1 NagC family transcriptional regulator [Sphingomonas paucimobilis]